MPTFLKRSFRFWQSLGIHVVRNHYYQPVPDTRYLKDELWNRPPDAAGIDLNEEKQRALLSRFRDAYYEEYKRFPLEKTETAFEYYVHNARYESVDGEILYGMVREFRPKRILEFGAGFSTLMTAQAIRKNMAEDASYRCDFISVDPEPRAVIRFAVPGLTRLVEGIAQDWPPAAFDELESGDILFIDSSHVLKIGSDVHYLFLQVLPRLRSGVIVHVHDIFFPEEYPRDWVLGHLRFYTEQYLLQAFLQFNSAFEVLWGGAFMRGKHPDELARAIPSFRPEQDWPGSFWMRRK
ncbi:class I SAM-dependent methyltransferase [bacterium]|nr:class I SAM-dependent methyltransferase [bacterium]MBU1984642.1 class I SAM-dependent methyltransferase [bacterium]